MSNIKIVALILLSLLILLTAFLVFSKRQGQIGPLPIIQFSPEPSSPTTSSSSQMTFQITETNPKDQQKDVYSGEIEISFTTNNDILSDKEFLLEITPSEPFSYNLINTFPTKKVVARILGGLQTNTTYQVTIKDKAGKLIYSWSFTTSSSPAEASSALMQKEEKQLIQKYYPLFDYVPYTSTDFDLDTNGRLTIDVKVKNPDIQKVKQEVEDWIRSKGVDPGTHTINYINSF